MSRFLNVAYVQKNAESGNKAFGKLGPITKVPVWGPGASGESVALLRFDISAAGDELTSGKDQLKAAELSLSKCCNADAGGLIFVALFGKKKEKYHALILQSKIQLKLSMIFTECLISLKNQINLN